MTMPVKFRGKRYSDNDEAARRRARGISQLGKSYAQGAAYSDIDESSTTAERLDATKDYDMMSRIRPSGAAMKQVVSSYSEKVRKKGKR